MVWVVLGLVATGLWFVTHHGRTRLPWSGTSFPSATGPASRLAGLPHVADGDSVTLEGQRIRLVGIDAPELDQTCVQADAPYACGRQAREHLLGLLAGGPVECTGSKLDKYHRLLAVCRAGGVDLNAAMVRDGWAVAYGGYESEEAEARAARRGLWAGGFAWPQDFRKAKRADATDDGWD